MLSQTQRFKMTQENREKQYLHFRDLEKNYEALPGRDHDLEDTKFLRKRSGESADAMLVKNPELDELVNPVKEVVVEEPKKEVKKTKSKGKK